MAHREDKWMERVHEHLNRSSPETTVGGYSLELVLCWSIFKMSLYGPLPLAASFAVYMQASMGKVDDFGTGLSLLQATWGVISYVVGTAGGEALILAQPVITMTVVTDGGMSVTLVVS